MKCPYCHRDVALALVDPESIIPDALAKIVASLTPEVIRIRYNFGYDHHEEPAVYFRILLSDEAGRRENLLTISRKTEALIVAQIDLGNLHPYFNVRREFEQFRMRDPAWD